MHPTCNRIPLRSLTALVLVGFAWTAVHSSEEPRTAEDLPALEKTLQELYAKVAPCTVNLFVEPKHEHAGSGVIIDAKGLVLTHAHQGQAPGTRFSAGLDPGTQITAVFPDGKKVRGKVLAFHEPFDLSLFQLEGDGPWPAVPLGDPARLKSGELCVMLGYPKMHHREGEPPLLRLGRFLGPWGHYLLTSCNLNGGDSGGPLFTLDGKLLGNNNLCPTHDDRRAGHGSGHTSVEYFQRIRSELLEGRYTKRPDSDFRFNAPSGRFDYPIIGAFKGVAGLESLVITARNCVVTVLDGDKPVALGVVVDPDGWVVTKASELPFGEAECRLADGRQVKTVVAGKDRDHDLALLKLPVGNLRAAQWSDRPLAAGQVLAAVGPGPQPLAVGIVACATRNVPGQIGVLAIDVAAAPNGGVRVTTIHPSRPRTAAVLKPGDLVKQVEETPTPDRAAFAAAVGECLRGLGGRPGERVRLTVVRDSGELQVAVPVEAAYDRPWSARHDGFASAFVYDGVVLRSECGGPLVGTDGKLAGVVIARIGPETRAVLSVSDSRTYAIPALVVKKVVAKLRQKHLEDPKGK